MKLTKSQARVLAALQQDNDRRYAEGLDDASPVRYIAGLAYFDGVPVPRNANGSTQKHVLAVTQMMLDALRSRGLADTHLAPLYSITIEGRNALRTHAGLDTLPPLVRTPEQIRVEEYEEARADLEKSLRFRGYAVTLEPHPDCVRVTLTLDDLDLLTGQIY